MLSASESIAEPMNADSSTILGPVQRWIARLRSCPWEMIVLFSACEDRDSVRDMGACGSLLAGVQGR